MGDTKLGRVIPISSPKDYSKLRYIERLPQNWADQPNIIISFVDLGEDWGSKEHPPEKLMFFSCVTGTVILRGWILTILIYQERKLRYRDGKRQPPLKPGLPVLLLVAIGTSSLGPTDAPILASMRLT